MRRCTWCPRLSRTSRRRLNWLRGSHAEHTRAVWRQIGYDSSLRLQGGPTVRHASMICSQTSIGKRLFSMSLVAGREWGERGRGTTDHKFIRTPIFFPMLEVQGRPGQRSKLRHGSALQRSAPTPGLTTGCSIASPDRRLHHMSQHQGTPAPSCSSGYKWRSRILVSLP